MRSRFDNGTKVMIALGGWGDTAGFSAGAADNTSRALYAKNVAEMLHTHGFDGVDIDVRHPSTMPPTNAPVHGEQFTLYYTLLSICSKNR